MSEGLHAEIADILNTSANIEKAVDRLHGLIRRREAAACEQGKEDARRSAYFDLAEALAVLVQEKCA